MVLETFLTGWLALFSPQSTPMDATPAGDAVGFRIADHRANFETHDVKFHVSGKTHQTEATCGRCENRASVFGEPGGSAWWGSLVYSPCLISPKDLEDQRKRYPEIDSVVWNDERDRRAFESHQLRFWNIRFGNTQPRDGHGYLEAFCMRCPRVAMMYLRGPNDIHRWDGALAREACDYSRNDYGFGEKVDEVWTTNEARASFYTHEWEITEHFELSKITRRGACLYCGRKAVAQFGRYDLSYRWTGDGAHLECTKASDRSALATEIAERIQPTIAASLSPVSAQADGGNATDPKFSPLKSPLFVWGVVVLLACSSATACHWQALRKNRHGFLWSVIGLLTGPVGIVAIALVPPKAIKQRTLASEPWDMVTWV